MKTPLLLLLAVSLFFCCGRQPKENAKPQDPKLTLVDLIDSLHLKKEDLSILINKSHYRLFVRTDTSTIREYPVVFGTNPIDDKRMQGDRSTPEGSFKVREFYPHKSWSKFVWIDYPTQDSWKKHNTAKSDGSIPEDAKIGGEIGIHGVPDNRSSLISERVNWTWGCISMTNEHVNDLYGIVYKGMNIEIMK